MKKLMSIVLSSLLFANVSFADTHTVEPKAPETKKVCKEFEVKGKITKQCKTVKLHKKFEGTKVPTPVKKGK